MDTVQSQGGRVWNVKTGGFWAETARQLQCESASEFEGNNCTFFTPSCCCQFHYTSFNTKAMPSHCILCNPAMPLTLAIQHISLHHCMVVIVIAQLSFSRQWLSGMLFQFLLWNYCNTWPSTIYHTCVLYHWKCIFAAVGNIISDWSQRFYETAGARHVWNSWYSWNTPTAVAVCHEWLVRWQTDVL